MTALILYYHLTSEDIYVSLGKSGDRWQQNIAVAGNCGKLRSSGNEWSFLNYSSIYNKNNILF